ncbi:hypothetical protein IPN41_02510 [Candidatus Falkowbacteria bacterium]|nr:MAG: hypothetical protein IPN41_02510 [Candidatus Falkowbacteria bacterium]
MTLNSIIIDSGKIISKFIFDMIFFPFWWYTRGFFNIIVWSKNFLGQRLKSTGLLVWVKNIFTPMYGQHDWAGILISFLTRSMQIVFRSGIMLFWLIFVFLVVFLWLTAPAYILFQLMYQFNLLKAI